MVCGSKLCLVTDRIITNPIVVTTLMYSMLVQPSTSASAEQNAALRGIARKNKDPYSNYQAELLSEDELATAGFEELNATAGWTDADRKKHYDILMKYHKDIEERKLLSAEDSSSPDFDKSLSETPSDAYFQFVEDESLPTYPIMKALQEDPDNIYAQVNYSLTCFPDEDRDQVSTKRFEIFGSGEDFRGIIYPVIKDEVKDGRILTSCRPGYQNGTGKLFDTNAFISYLSIMESQGQGIDLIVDLEKNPDYSDNVNEFSKKKLNIDVMKLPVKDGEYLKLEECLPAFEQIAERFEKGDNILIYCLAGEGRTGLIMNQLFLYLQTIKQQENRGFELSALYNMEYPTFDLYEMQMDDKSRWKATEICYSNEVSWHQAYLSYYYLETVNPNYIEHSCQYAAARYFAEVILRNSEEFDEKILENRSEHLFVQHYDVLKDGQKFVGIWHQEKM